MNESLFLSKPLSDRVGTDGAFLPGTYQRRLPRWPSLDVTRATARRILAKSADWLSVNTNSGAP